MSAVRIPYREALSRRSSGSDAHARRCIAETGGIAHTALARRFCVTLTSANKRRDEWLFLEPGVPHCARSAELLHSQTLSFVFVSLRIETPPRRRRGGS